MPNIFLYIPFPNVTDDPTMRTVIQDLRKSGLQFTLVDDDRDANFLAAVEAEDLLMIVSHGLKNYNSLFVKYDGNLQSVTANTLAERIETGGLRKTHESILMLSCYAGGETTLKTDADGESVPSGLTSVNHGKFVPRRGQSAAGASPYKCMSSVVAKALGLRGYRNILVGGFPGAFGLLPAGADSVTLWFSADDTAGKEVHILAELDHIQWFDRSGVGTAEIFAKVSNH